jgi:hypothetical protein
MIILSSIILEEGDNLRWISKHVVNDVESGANDLFEV